MPRLEQDLMKLYLKSRERFRVKWNRCLPFYEMVLGDDARWEKARFLGFGEKTSIYQSSYVYGNVKVGKNTWIGPFTVLDGTGGLEIGDYCSISCGVQIYTHETVEWALTGGKAKYAYASVRIGDCSFLGSLSVVRLGVKIGDHCVVGAHSYVDKSIPSHSIAAGCPAKVVGRVAIKRDKVRLEYFDKEDEDP